MLLTLVSLYRIDFRRTVLLEASTNDSVKRFRVKIVSLANAIHIPVKSTMVDIKLNVYFGLWDDRTRASLLQRRFFFLLILVQISKSHSDS